MTPTVGSVRARVLPVRLAVLLLTMLAFSPLAAQELRAGGDGEEDQPEEPDEPPRGWRFEWDDHPSLRFGQDTRIDFRARFQAHLRDSEAPIGDDETVDLARRRIGLDGRIAGVVDFQLEREIADDNPWRDVYADYRQFTAVRVQAGKFKLPFSLDENTSPTNLDFVYRSRAASQLAPGRDWGVMVHGRVARSIVGYEVGWFDHDGNNARTNNPDRVYGEGTIAGRVSAQPFRSIKGSPLRDLEAGFAWTESDVPLGFSGLRGRTALDASFYSGDVWVQGRRRRTGIEARWRPGPFSVKAEYMRVSTERQEQSVESTDLSALIGKGWYVSGTWAVTGESKADGLDEPRRSIFGGGAGAIELAARIEALSFGSGASGEPPSTSPRADVIAGNRDRVVTFGVNWYPFRGLKLQANAIREAIAEAAEGPLPSKPAFWSGVIRFQFSI